MKLRVKFQVGIDDLVKMCIISLYEEKWKTHQEKTLFLSNMIKNSRASL